ncbi:MAG: hypothetical protein GY712_04875 [Oceanicoccus sp.]|uniref:hypothetical protein n=1 Tax=Oceanicoccus sp. TaxID=2691044 RepID=UPI0026100EF0|nr:hypothetical protein [Oceanicoccus sp.]MCP3907332.1 hypothetical protein [Oceanicoccus sp.]
MEAKKRSKLKPNGPSKSDIKSVTPANIPPSPPTSIDPAGTIFQHTAPIIDDITAGEVDQKDLSRFIDEVDLTEMEKRITLLSRMVLEDALWKKDGLSVKERADLALNAIKVFEGTKTTLWTRDDDMKDKPKDKEAYDRERKRLLKSVAKQLQEEDLVGIAQTGLELTATEKAMLDNLPVEKD